MDVERETLVGNNKTKAKEGCLVQFKVEATTTNVLHFSTMPGENVTTQRVWRSKNTKACYKTFQQLLNMVAQQEMNVHCNPFRKGSRYF